MPVQGTPLTPSGGPFNQAGNALFVSNIREEVRTELGEDCVDVELSDQQIDKAIKDAIRVYNLHRPRRNWRMLDASPEKNRYDVTETGIQNIVRVGLVDRFHVERNNISATRNPFVLETYAFAGGDYYMGGFDDHGSMIGEYAHILAYNEEVRRVTSSQNEWAVEWRDDRLILWLDLSKDRLSPFRTAVSYEATFGYEPDNNATNGMQFIPAYDVDAVYDMITGRAMQILGRIRDKYKGVIGPDGSAIRLDGEAMKREGQERFTQGRDALKKRRRPLGPITDPA